jgi:hypothetical protein
MRDNERNRLVIDFKYEFNCHFVPTLVLTFDIANLKYSSLLNSSHAGRRSMLLFLPGRSSSSSQECFVNTF